MIEYCTKKIMMGTISGLMILCIAVLYLEDTLMEQQHQQHAGPPAGLSATSLSATQSKEAETDSSKCSIKLQQQQVAAGDSGQACQPCSQFEQRLASQLTAGPVLAACADTGFKRLVGGVDGCPPVWIACKPSAASSSSEGVKFFVAQGVSLIVFLIAFGCVKRRERQLDQLLADRVSKQLAAGV